MFDSCKFRVLILICSLTAFVFLQGCKGAECAASVGSTTDVDSDCVPDASDNCPFTYNPLQRDTDDNSIGDECEDEEGVAELVKFESDPALIYPKPQTEASTKTSDFQPVKNCVAYYVLGCHGHTIETFESEDRDANSADSLYNPESTFGSLTGTCSAFNDLAPWPPALYCLKQDEDLFFVGYLSSNPAINQGFSACSALSQLGKPADVCEE